MLTTPVQTTLSALDLARAGRFAEIRDLFAPQLQALVPPEALKAAWEAELGRQGAVASVGAPVSEPMPAGVVVVKVPVTCERGASRWSRRSARRVSSEGCSWRLQGPPSRSRRGSRRLTLTRRRSPSRR